MPAPTVWTDPFTVRSYEIGPDGRLTVPTLCDYLQEAAGNHATALGVATDRLLADGLAWLLARLQVEVFRLPAWREEIAVQTWPSAADGLYAQRDFSVTDSDGDQIARATSQWFVLNVERRRPTRLPAEVLAFDLPDRPHALEPGRAPHPSLEVAEHERLFTVRRSDLDLNRHVNNVRFVEWALEAVPDEIQETRTLRSLDVQFRAESVYGDTIRSACATEESSDGVALTHEVTRESDGQLLARARTVWR